MHNLKEVVSAISAVGIPKQDAEVIADCVITRTSCSWVNNETLNPEVLENLHNLIIENKYNVKVIVQEVGAAGNKYIWEVKTD